MKLLKTVRADTSDTFVFEKAAEAGEWAVSGAFLFANLDPTSLTGRPRAAFRGGFLGVNSFGWSTLAQIVEVAAEERATAVALLATRLVEHCGAPDLAAATAAAEEEIEFAASLCNHPAGMLIAVSRRYETETIRESFRTLQANPSGKSPVFSFIELIDDEPALMEHSSLPELVDRARQ
jgi:Family of unknown function (DUF6505)